MKRITTLAIGMVLASGGVALAQQEGYVGDGTCRSCHHDFPRDGFYQDYINSGHPWKLFQSRGFTPGATNWPFTPVPPLPMANGEQVEWSDVEYVIGNYYWKARFVDREGYIITGGEDDSTQWNLATQEFVPYHPGEVRPYNCGRCHTTGYDPEGSQEGLPGIVGTWAETGVRCEACHGPGREHVDSFGVIHPPGGKDCSDCHYRDADFRMPWRNGFMRHHQQAEDMSHSPHFFLNCTTCHEPHKSTVYELGGLKRECSSCHAGDADNGFYRIDGMEFLDCYDCHMPHMGKSATSPGEFIGDIRGHIFRIMTEPIAAEDNVYEEDGQLFWNQDGDGQSAVTVDYACRGCHLQIGFPLSNEFAAFWATDIHNEHPAPPPVCPEDLDGSGEVDSADLAILLAGWGDCDPDCPEDLDGNGIVNSADLAILLAAWGPCEDGFTAPVARKAGMLR